jgi:hypothetical protein
MQPTLYDKTGRAYALDHEHDGLAYVRPLVKVIIQTSNYRGDDFSEDEDLEPADYLISMDRADLFDAPPVAALNADIEAKKEELQALKAEHARTLRETTKLRESAERELEAAKRRLEDWNAKHRTMIELGRMLDGAVLYPLSLKERATDIPRIPTMRHARYLSLRGGDFEKGQKWTLETYSRDYYGTPFRFFDTEEERFAVILEQFEKVCQAFREKPDFSGRDLGSTPNYRRLEEWVKAHPSLTIPDDIEEMKRNHDAELVEQRKAKLAEELAALEATN